MIGNAGEESRWYGDVLISYLISYYHEYIEQFIKVD